MKYFVLFALLATPALAGAAEFSTLTNIPQLTDAASSSNLTVFLNGLYKLCIGIAVVIAVLQLMRAGIEYMTAGGSVGSTEHAKHLISTSILGLVLVLSPYLVFSIVNPSILTLKIDTSEIKPTNKGIAPNYDPTKATNPSPENVTGTKVEQERIDACTKSGGIVQKGGNSKVSSSVCVTESKIADDKAKTACEQKAGCSITTKGKLGSYCTCETTTTPAPAPSTAPTQPTEDPAKVACEKEGGTWTPKRDLTGYSCVK